MPMERDAYENLLSELLNPEIEHSRRTELLQELRVDYNGVLSDFENMTKTNTHLQKERDDLVVSNSKLFRQVGIVGNEDKEKEQEQLNRSETIRLEDFEK